MSVTVKTLDYGPAIEVAVTSKLHKADYDEFIPLLEQAIQQYGKIRLLLDMHDFHGWDFGAFWEDLKFGIKDFNHFDRIAMVGEKNWEKAMSILCKPFVSGTVRYFDHSEKTAALNWLLEESPVNS